MPRSLDALHATWCIIRGKPRQIRRLVLPPFLLAMAFKAWLGVQMTGEVRPDLPGHDLALRGTLALALAVMAFLWHRAIYFGPRAPLTAGLALTYWGQGALFSLLGALPFMPLAAMMTAPGFAVPQLHLAVFAADSLSLWLVLVFGIVVARRAGGEAFPWRKAWVTVPTATTAVLAMVLALVLQIQGVLTGALAALHSGAAFLLDGAITFALILTVLTLMARPKQD